MNLHKLKYFLFSLALVMLYSCRQAKYVGEGDYLLKSNEILFDVDDGLSEDWEAKHAKLDEYEIKELARPEPNDRFLGMKMKLFFYNRIDSAKRSAQIEKKRLKYEQKNEKRAGKVYDKNIKRIKKAKEKGETRYKKKSKKPKTRRYGWRNWITNRWGEAPVLLDTAKISKSKQQMKVYLSQRGYKGGVVTDSIYYNEKKQKAEVTYYIKPGKPYIINSITFDPAPRNEWLIKQYKRMIKEEGTALKVGDLLDEDVLDDERDHYTKYLKDNAYFGFTKSYINFVVDTTKKDFKADLTIYIKEKVVTDPQNPDSTVVINHFVYLVDEVTYKLHNPDSLSFKDWEGYKKRCQALGLSEPYQDEKKNYYLLDTTLIIDTLINVHRLNLNSDRRKNHNLGVFEKYVDTVIIYKGYFIYNETPFIRPELLDKQNFLEHTDLSLGIEKYAKDYYIDRTFKSLLMLDVFSKITPKLEISPSNPLGNYVDVTYDLTPSKKQQFTIEPRATNTASILGVSGRLAYTNKNINRGANKLVVSIEGGAQSQPLFSADNSSNSKSFRFRGLNTFEIGPEVTYEIPKFFPMTKKMAANLSKRSFPSTKMGILYNFQSRPEFFRHVAEVSYKWQFSSPNQTQIFTVTPVRFDYIFLDKQPDFEAALQATNDPFLINSYSNYFSLGVLNIRHEYNNQKLSKNKRRFKRDHGISNVIEFTAAGLLMNTVDALATPEDFVTSFNTQGKLLFQVPFAQYAKIENTFIFNQVLNKKHRLAYRFNVGLGLPYANGLALPYTQSFVAGGSNDIRAFNARTMAPGATQVWDDPNGTETQIGDMKLMANLEWRFKIAGKWNGAIFVDAGNIWKVNSDDPLDPGLFDFAKFYKQIAIGTGFGVRYDLTYLILRLDLSWAIHNPYLPAGSRWWLRDNGGIAIYNNSFKVDGAGNKVDYVLPHHLNFNIGIGYPF